MVRSPRLVQSEPLPVTSAELLLLAARFARMPLLFSTVAPLPTMRRFIAPLLPTNKFPPISQRALALNNCTALDLAVALRPITPLPELVSSALSDKATNVNEP